MRFELIGSINDGHCFDCVVDTKLFEHIEAINDVAKGRVASIHQVEAGGCELGLIEKHEELGGAVVEFVG